MMRTMPGLPAAAVCLLLTTPLALAAAAEPDAGEIVRRASEHTGGDDFFSRLRFTFEHEGERSTLSMVMAYKAYQGRQGLDAKVIMFNEFPPDRKDVGFLAWIRRPAAGRDDMWLYLPELRQIRKMTHKHQDHSHGDPHEDEFAVSVLGREDLTPRPPQLDRHRLLDTDTLGDVPVYVVESTPRDPATSSYGRRVQWIARSSFLPLRIDYYDRAGRRLKTEDITWQRLGGAWVWDEVTAVDRDGNRTRLKQSDIQINLGLPDNLFSKRVLRKGAQALASRVARLADRNR